MKNQRGFTLLEVLVVAAMMATTGLLFAEMMVGQSKQLQVNHNSVSTTQLTSFLSATLASTGSCLAAIGPSVAPPTTSTYTGLAFSPAGPLASIVPGSYYMGVPIDCVGWNLINNPGGSTEILNVHIAYGGVQNGLPFSGDPCIVPNDFGTQKQSDAPGSLSAMKTLDIPFQATIGSGGVITGCSATTDYSCPSGTCNQNYMATFTSAGGTALTASTIFQDPVTGNVGIGTSSPTAPLSVTSASTSGLSITGTAASGISGLSITAPGADMFSLYVTGVGSPGVGNFAIFDNVNSAARFAVSPAGNVGIGGNVTAAPPTFTGASMVVQSSGNVGIGTASPSYLLHVSSTAAGAVAGFTSSAGTCSLTPTSAAATFACSSDESLKKDIAPISGQDVLDRLMNLKAVTYALKKGDNGERHTGYIAQNVRRVSPEFVTTGPDGLLQVSYAGFIPWITEGIKELYSKFTHTQAQVEDHSKRLEALAAELAQLKAENTELKLRLGSLENAQLKARLSRRETAAATK